ncbi:MAG: S8 family serine peptidase [Bacteriovoracaceae bacterium]
MNLISCAPKLDKIKKRDLKLGYIVLADKNEVNNVITKVPGVSVRALSEKANIFEIKGMAKSEIVSKLGHIEGFQIEENAVVSEEMPMQEQKIVLNNESGNKTEIPGFKYACENSPFLEDGEEPLKNSPKAEIGFASNGGDVFKIDSTNNIVTSPNAVVKLTGAGSLPDQLVGGKLKYSWIVEPPAYSIYDVTREVNTVDFSFKIDAMGPYKVTLIVQDKNRICSSYAFEFNVTANAPYVKVESTPAVNNEYFENFTHLKTMGIQDSWTNGTGEGIKVAVIDSGVNYLHPDLSTNIAINTKEIPDNGVDDDKNGFVDDTIGWDFVNDDNMPFDDGGHGTHVAGLIASKVFGVAPNAKILPIKAFNARGSCELSTIIMGFLYAIDQGANVINFSAGSHILKWKLLNGVLQYAKMKQVTIVVAAGNNITNVDFEPIFPINLNLENIISVAATNNDNELSLFSNFGKRSIEFAAPGGGAKIEKIKWKLNGSSDLSNIDNLSVIFNGKPEKRNNFILSTAMWNANNIQLAYMQGTSMSAPLVAGTVAAMIGIDPTLAFRNADLKNILIKTMTPSSSLTNKIKNAGVIHAGRATTLTKEKKVLK